MIKYLYHVRIIWAKQTEYICDQFIKQANMFVWGKIKHNVYWLTWGTNTE